MLSKLADKQYAHLLLPLLQLLLLLPFAVLSGLCRLTLLDAGDCCCSCDRPPLLLLLLLSSLLVTGTGDSLSPPAVWTTLPFECCVTLVGNGPVSGESCVVVDSSARLAERRAAGGLLVRVVTVAIGQNS